MARGEAGNDTNGDSTDYNNMRVGTLRKIWIRRGWMWMAPGRQ